MDENKPKHSSDKPKQIPPGSRWDPKAIEAALQKAAQHAKKLSELHK